MEFDIKVGCEQVAWNYEFLFKFLSSAYVAQYISFMCPLLAAPSRIGRSTNFLQKLSEFEEFEIASLRRPSEFGVDYIRVMAEVVGAEERRVPSIQVSIVDQAFRDQR